MKHPVLLMRMMIEEEAAESGPPTGRVGPGGATGVLAFCWGGERKGITGPQFTKGTKAMPLSLF
jgi:hypothetical protein